ncbi:helix-turn-helix domain-containing protein [Schleiferilactobacillus harbinensis]|uniref:Helix-turn-helix domain-containing protein n=1 Tax=Schleiferilactobacillus harbinensis TaxID=304207 RepID=A0A5P8M727_9LACO|nr:helix-turn-helix transcriptional regulator [Schleiferilactobacillus harbinensis]QFR24117.1 helix-turn-helix domain-containing protein [Schleiferilactobacillus harbinensis]
MPRKIIVGKMIRYYLDQNHMTMKELGAKLGKSESTVSKWISGTSTPMAKDLSTMTEIFHTSIDHLMYGGEPTRSEDHATLIAAHIDDNVTDSDMADILDYIEKLKKANKYEREHGE